MIFVRSRIGNTLFLMLSEVDVTNQLRPGRTLFVNHTHLKGETFDNVVISLHENDKAAMDLLQKVDPKGFGAAVKDFRLPEKAHDQEQCPVCKSFSGLGSIFKGRCIVCWSQYATELEIRCEKEKT